MLSSWQHYCRSRKWLQELELACWFAFGLWPQEECQDNLPERTGCMQITSSWTVTEAINTEQFLAPGVFWMGDSLLLFAHQQSCILLLALRHSNSVVEYMAWIYASLYLLHIVLAFRWCLQCVLWLCGCVTTWGSSARKRVLLFSSFSVLCMVPHCTKGQQK